MEIPKITPKIPLTKDDLEEFINEGFKPQRYELKYYTSEKGAELLKELFKIGLENEKQNGKS